MHTQREKQTNNENVPSCTEKNVEWTIRAIYGVCINPNLKIPSILFRTEIKPETGNWALDRHLRDRYRVHTYIRICMHKSIH